VSNNVLLFFHMQHVRGIARTLTLSGKDLTQLAKPSVYAAFCNCQRFTYTCAARGDRISPETLHLSLMEALPHLGQLEYLQVEVEDQQQEVGVEQEEKQDMDMVTLFPILLFERDKKELKEWRNSTW
jgi:hypothetical protein